jgi:hypothetical protein
MGLYVLDGTICTRWDYMYSMGLDGTRWD